MLFNSYVYIFLFLPLTVIGFFLIGSRVHHRAALAWLIGASLFFYGWWNPAYVSLIVGSMLFNYTIGVLLKNQKKTNFYLKGLLIFGVAANLGLIGYYKYANFFMENVSFALGNDFHFKTIILPLAISFFTFQQIAYLVDAYKSESRESDFLHYCLFVTFFPQLIAGPIVHHKEMMPQFGMKKTFKPHAENFAVGISVFAIGLFKKVILADGVAVYASPVFKAAENSAKIITLFDAWEGAIAYTLQIYFDFSGYTDMAIGSAMLFGIILPLNFNSPYKALNIIDFWRRWHMTLSRFFRDYIYFPLGGNRVSPPRMLVNLSVTMLLGGLWHGAGWTFLVWGGLHGFYLIINHVWRDFRGKVMGHDLERITFAGKIVSIGLTMLTVMIAWVFFRADTLSGAVNIISGMIGMNGAAIPQAFTEVHPAVTQVLEKLHISGVHDSGTIFLTKWITFLLFSAILFMPNSIQYVNNIFAAKKLSNGKIFAHTMLICFMLTWAVLAVGKPSEFLYFQF